MPLNSYSTGTVTIGAGATTIVGAGCIWSSPNARPGDIFYCNGYSTTIEDVVDNLHLAIEAWPFGAIAAGSAYKILQVSPLRFSGGQAMADVSTLVAALNTDGFYWFVPSIATVPDPSYGEDGQYAYQAVTGKLWLKESGAWSFVGVFKGFNIRGAYNNATAYAVNDVVYRAGSSYVAILLTIGNAPPNATYWQLFAAAGVDGAAATVAAGTTTTRNPGAGATVTNSGSSSAAVFDFGIPSGLGYGGTSATSLAIATGSKAFTLAGTVVYAYQIGDYVRSKSAANGANFMEGFVTGYNTGTNVLTVSVIKIGGSGTFTDWNVSLAGASGIGDVVSTNNGTEFAPAPFATNLSLVRYASQSLTSAQQAQVRANIDVVKKNYILNGGMMVSQENGSTAGTTTLYYPVDQFSFAFSNAGSISVAQVASATPGGSPNRIRATVTSADSSVGSADSAGIFQRIEGYRIAELRSGSASAKTVTIQFGVKAPAGTYCVALRNLAGRSYVAEYTIAVGEANTDVVKNVVLTLDTSGTWATDNGLGIDLWFGLMCGSSLQTTAGVWTAGSFIGSPNQFNFMGTNGNVFELFDVGMYEGNVAPPFKVPDYPSELLACMRYYYKFATIIVDVNTIAQGMLLPAKMRGAITWSGGGAGFTANGFSDFHSGFLFQTARANVSNLAANARL
jgi:hypothetical protein